MPEAGAEIGKGIEPEIIKKPEKQAVSRLGASLEKVKGLSWKTIRSAIRGEPNRAEQQAKKEGAEPRQISELGPLRQQIEETAGVLLEKGEGSDVSELSRQIREWIKEQKEKASPEALARLEELERGVNDFDTRQILGELSSDPEMLTKQMFVILAGPEGKDLVETLGEVVNQKMQEQEGERQEEGEQEREEIQEEEAPYPWQSPPELKIGRSRWLDLRFLGCLLPLSCCVLSVLFSPEAGRRVIRRTVGRIPAAGPLSSRLWTGAIEWGIRKGERFSETGEERKERQIRKEVREEDARGLFQPYPYPYPYSRILGLEEQGNEDLALARLDRAAEFIDQGEYTLDQVRDPRLIVRLILDERYKEYEFSSDQIKDPEKRRKVEELLKELEKKEKEESSLRPSSRKTAEAREKQKLTSVRTQARRGKTLSRRERGLV